MSVAEKSPSLPQGSDCEEKLSVAEEKSPTLPKVCDSDYPEQSKTEDAVKGELLTDTMLAEEERLKEESAKKEDEWQEQKSAVFRDMESEEVREQRYKRLQYLLQKSNMYTSYLLERMEKQAKEAKDRQKRREKKLERERKQQEEAALREKQEKDAAEDSMKENLPHPNDKENTAMSTDTDIKENVPCPDDKENAAKSADTEMKENLPGSDDKENTAKSADTDKLQQVAPLSGKNTPAGTPQSTPTNTPRTTRRSLRLQSPNATNEETASLPVKKRGRKRKASTPQTPATSITDLFKAQQSSKKRKCDAENEDPADKAEQENAANQSQHSKDSDASQTVVMETSTKESHESRTAESSSDKQCGKKEASADDSKTKENQEDNKAGDSKTKSAACQEDNKAQTAAALTQAPSGVHTKNNDKDSSSSVSGMQPVLLTGATLRDYQLEGFHWLKVLYENGVNGILADEMGLGKTIQCISLIAHLSNMGVPGPFLIVAPLSTLPNWLCEFQRFTPKVPVVLYHGSKEDRLRLRKDIIRKYQIRKGIEIHPTVITSYEIAMNDRKSLQSFMWRYLVVDEGHRIKNNQCRLVRELKMYTSTNRLLLTGTPLQNNLAELWSLLNFLLPDIFDDLGSFEAWFDIDYLEAEGSDEHIVCEEKKKNILGMLHQILTPFMLRRLKSDVDLMIPPKREILLFCPLSSLQQDFYRKVVDGSIVDEMEKKKGVHTVELDSKGRPVRKSTKNVKYNEVENDENDDVEEWMKDLIKQQEKKERDKQSSGQCVQQSVWNLKLTNVMMMLRHVCNHPYLIEWPLDPKTGEFSLNEKLIKTSGKLMMLDLILPELKRRGHKVLIFSQMTKILNILEDFCYLRKFSYCRLDGAMKVEDRKEQMHEFNTEKESFIFLLSTRAGGLGINLVAADTVIIFDSDWNPQGDLQAQDRCHRIGQSRPVMVYRMVAANTIDHKIVERAAAKRKLEKMVIHKGKFKSGLESFKSSMAFLSPEELMALLKSRDYDDVKRHDKAMMTDAELHQLLDRSDLFRQWQKRRNQETDQLSFTDQKILEQAEKISQMKDVAGLFKVLDDDIGRGYLSTKDSPAESS